MGKKYVGKLLVLLGIIMALTGMNFMSAKAVETPEINGVFYDSDKTTPILKVTTEVGDTDVYLNQLLPSEKVLKPVRRGYQLDRWYHVEKDKVMACGTVYNKFVFKKDFTMVAIWKTQPYEYNIQYHLNKGQFQTGPIPYTFNVQSSKIKLPTPVKSGYTFDGWYTASKGGQKISAINAGTYIDSDKNGDVGDYHVYARWTSAKPKAPAIVSAKNTATGKVCVKYKASDKAKGYEIYYSQDSHFKKNVHVVTTKNLSVDISNLPKGKTYYFKVKAYGKDSLGNVKRSDFSKVLSRKITDGVTEVAPTASSAKLTEVKVKGKDQLYVEASVSKRLKSSDDYYYLVKVDPVTGKYEKKIAKTEKNKTAKFFVPLKDGKGKNLIQGKYAIAVKKNSSYMLVSKSAYIKNPEDAADYTAPFPERKTKKGLQGYLGTDLNAKHTFVNMNLRDVLDGTIPYEYNGKTYYFKDNFSGYISSANQMGMTVSGQVMLSWIPGKTYMILPSGRTEGHAYYAMNTKDKKAREELEAAFCFIAERYSRPECHLDNWILGNEVNIHQMWYYAGNISREDFMQNYASTFRILYYAVKSNSKNARVYICTDHTWSDRANEWGAKGFINLFSTKIAQQDKHIQWNLAFHAYPSNLLQSATWNDANADNNEWCGYVTPKNLDVLTKYMSANYGKKTRIILSEQGFTSTCGEDVQAAGIAYLYYKAEFNDMIDAVIFRAVQDNPVESAQGLRMGLSTEDGRPKKAYNVFKYMDTPSYSKYANKYMSTIGISKWSQIAPGFDPSRFK